jgi:Transposase, Mutator family
MAIPRSALSEPVEADRACWSSSGVNRESERQTDVVGIFPNETAVTRPAGSIRLELHDAWAIAERHYLSRARWPSFTGRAMMPRARRWRERSTCSWRPERRHPTAR